LEERFELPPGCLKEFAGFIGFSPWLDIMMESPSVSMNESVDYLTVPPSDKSVPVGWFYAKGVEAMHRYSENDGLLEKEVRSIVHNTPYVIPVLADDLKTGLPPMLIFAGGAELIVSDSIGLFGRMTGNIVPEGYHKSSWLLETTHTAVNWSQESSEGGRDSCTEKVFHRLAESDSSDIRVEVYLDLIHVFLSFPHIRERKMAYRQISRWSDSIGWLQERKVVDNTEPGLYLVDCLETLKKEKKRR
jgi:acetyl esterase/lipase